MDNFNETVIVGVNSNLLFFITTKIPITCNALTPLSFMATTLSPSSLKLREYFPKHYEEIELDV
jgi:hypothetical protein